MFTHPWGSNAPSRQKKKLEGHLRRNDRRVERCKRTFEQKLKALALEADEIHRSLQMVADYQAGRKLDSPKKLARAIATEVIGLSTSDLGIRLDKVVEIFDALKASKSK
jgi:hypothetical protein